MRIVQMLGVIVFAMTGMALHIPRAEAAAAWAVNGGSRVPVGTVGVNVAAGAVTAGAGATVTLYCAVNSQVPGFQAIEMTYKGPSGSKMFTTAALIGMSKATGVETDPPLCTIRVKSSNTIATEYGLCNSSALDFVHNYYYIRIVLKSGIVAGQLQTVYGISLIDSV
jgi:hypothetical protein